MLQFLNECYEDYEEGLAEINKDYKPTFSHLNSAKRVYLNRRDSKFYMESYDSRKTTLQQYLNSLCSPPNVIPVYINFLYKDNFIINYNFALKLIIVYMGSNFKDYELNLVKEKVPNHMKFKIVTNQFRSSFRRVSEEYYEYIHDNIIKFISFYPMEFEAILKEYILRSYNFTERKPSEIRLHNLHVIINAVSNESTFVKSDDECYLINFKSAYPHEDLMINNQEPFVNVYDRQGNILTCYENNAFIIFGIINISIYIIKDNYKLNIDECYNKLLTTCINKYCQTSPSNNNSPSSE